MTNQIKDKCMRGIFLATLLLSLAGCSVHSDPSPAGTIGESAAPDTADHAGVLSFVPERPRPGQNVHVVYRPFGALAGEPRLILRARLRTRDDYSYNRLGSRTLGVLERQNDGSYGGVVSFTDEVVYAAVAVEDPAATRTDSRAGRFWEISVGDDDGRPLMEALEQRLHDHMGRDHLAVLESAREMTRLYPDHPAGWTNLRFAEEMVLGAEAAGEKATAYRERLYALDRGLAPKRELEADEVGHLYWQARSLGEEELAARWRERLFAEYPGHFFAVQERMIELHQQHGEDTAAILHGLEALWEVAEGRRARTRLAEIAFGAAMAHGETPLIFFWADRYSTVSPSSRGSVASALSDTEATREEGIRRLQEVISHYEEVPDEERPLGATEAEDRQQKIASAASLRHWLGRALLASERTEEGLAALEQSSAVGWVTSRFRALGSARLAAGDLEGAARAFAFAAADPATSADAIDSMRESLELEPGAWRDAVEDARAEMFERTLQSARSEALPPFTLFARGGSPVRFENLVTGAPTLVMFWSRYCSPSAQVMPRVAALAGSLEERGMRLVAVTRDSPADAEQYLQEAKLDIEAYFDTEGAAAQAFNSWGTPQFFVLDGTGRLRFVFSSLGDIERQMAALSAQEGSTTVAIEVATW
jgi:peroxiredoxin